MKIRLVTFAILCTLFQPLWGSVEQLRAQYQQLQDVYSERLETIQTEMSQKERELLNHFIISLVRVEQAFRDEGELDGVVITRELRETLLENPAFPEPAANHPAELRESIDSLKRDRNDIRENSQKLLNELNRMFYDRLEPIMRELTRAGDFDTARDMLELRQRLRASLGEPGERDPPERSTRELGMSADPNIFPLSIEPDSLGQIIGLTARRTQLAFDPVIEGRVTPQQRWIRLRGGRYTVPEDATRALVHQVAQNQMFTLEFGFYTDNGSQGRPHLQAPAGLFLFGNHREDANLIVNQEGRNLFLYLRTDSPPENRKFHRVNLGRVDPGRMVHYMVTYRSGELTVYADGVETQKLRSEISGLLNGWENYPFHIGSIDTPSPVIPVGYWNGDLVFVYMRASHESSRGAAANYTRFGNFVTAPR